MNGLLGSGRVRRSFGALTLAQDDSLLQVASIQEIANR